MVGLIGAGGSKPKRHVVHLGNQGGSNSTAWNVFSYNVKSNYPKIYKDLTKDNFRAVPYWWSGNSTSGSANTGVAYEPISYNSSSGIVRCGGTTIGPGGSWAGVLNYRVYMVYYD